MEIDMHYAADDSCQMQLSCIGHVDIQEFIDACKQYFLEWDERTITVSKDDVEHVYWYKRDAEDHEVLSDDGTVYGTSASKTDMPRTVLSWQPIHN